jgi:hypothetical protein
MWTWQAYPFFPDVVVLRGRWRTARAFENKHSQLTARSWIRFDRAASKTQPKRSAW